MRAPHCDSNVLHAPGECWSCDLYPSHQNGRIQRLINFTGEHDPEKHPCPAEEQRPLEKINLWPNNRPTVELSFTEQHFEPRLLSPVNGGPTIVDTTQYAPLSRRRSITERLRDFGEDLYDALMGLTDRRR